MFSHIPFFLLLLSRHSRAETSTPNTGDQLQDFSFSFATDTPVLPVISTCPSALYLTSGTPTNAGGPDPVAPYTLVLLVHEQLQDGAGVAYERMYSKSLAVGNLNQGMDISHPWGPGTQFIGCVWSSNAVSGGCQDLMTVVPSNLTEAAYRNATSQCRATDIVASWVPPSSQQLDVDIVGAAGTISSSGWPDTCSDIRVTPKNGTAPFTLLIAPAYHPPVNITSNTTFASDNSMNYTVRLTHGQAFFVSVYDSAGNSWAFGPLHAGASDDVSCLAVTTGQRLADKSFKAKGKVSLPALGGSIVAAFLVGALGACLIIWIYARRSSPKKRRSESQEELDPYNAPRRVDSYKAPAPSPYIDSPSPGIYTDPHEPHDAGRAYRESMGLGDWHPGPTSGSGEHHELSYGSGSGSASGSGTSTGKGMRSTKGLRVQNPAQSRNRIESEREQNELPEGARRGGRKIYVVHSDGESGNVTIRLPEGAANVVELPPLYRDDPRPRRTTDSPDIDALTLPFLDPSTQSGYNEDEFRARAEAVKAEKSRSQSGG
ncbi:hypothetical protein P7C73_g2335, partial [Tremellales sp. Uapishka_1]